MAKVINLTADAMDEAANSGTDGRWVKLEMRATDDDGNALTGTDRYYITACVVIAGDDGSSRKAYESAQLSAIPTGKMSNAQKLAIVDACKSAYSAAVKVATDDDV